MSDTLQGSAKIEAIEAIEVQIDGERAFRIPVDAAAHHPGELGEVLHELGRSSRHAAYASFTNFALTRTSSTSDPRKREGERAAWDANVRLLSRLLEERRDSIWIYVLQNISRPLFLKEQKFDVIVGNPPWIAYRYIEDPTYQGAIKKLIREYHLLEPDQTELYTQMEVATLFFEHCRRVYLKPSGAIAFVMPRSVITAAKQHYAFRRMGFSHIIDLKRVKPLFNVETCVMIREGNIALTEAIPAERFEGSLPGRDCSLAEARAVLRGIDAAIDLPTQENIASPYYYTRITDGATLYPRTLVFVTSAQRDLVPGRLARTKMRCTDPDVQHDAKPPWRGLSLEERFIHEDFLYATLLSRNLLPFGVIKCRGEEGFHLVALPVRIGMPRGKNQDLAGEPGEEGFVPVSVEEMRGTVEYARSADEWFDPAERLWSLKRQAKNAYTLAQWLNIQNKLLAQSPEPGYLVLYGATGSNLAAAVIDTRKLPIVHGVRPRAFVADHKTYWYRCSTLEEAHYLVALLNAPCVNMAIKAHQTRGLFGERDIHRRPFEICAIPRFNAGDPDHMRLAELSREAATIVAGLNLGQRGLVSARRLAREAAYMFISVMDDIAQDLLELAPVPGPIPEEN